jgi:hypothetical protein
MAALQRLVWLRERDVQIPRRSQIKHESFQSPSWPLVPSSASCSGDPEVAPVGITPSIAEEQGIAIDVHRLELAKAELAMIDGEADGFVALYTHDGVIVGATFVAAHAGESLPLLTLAVAQRMTPAGLAAVIACYPTQVEAIQRVAAQASTYRESGPEFVRRSCPSSQRRVARLLPIRFPSGGTETLDRAAGPAPESLTSKSGRT